MRHAQTPRRDQGDEAGNVLIICLILAFLFISFTLALLTSVKVNEQTVSHNVHRYHSHQAAVSGLAVAVDQINDSILNQNPRVTQEFAGNMKGIARSLSDPQVFDTTTTNANGYRPDDGALNRQTIEGTLPQVDADEPNLPMPTDSEMFQQPDGYFATRTERLPDGSWKVRVHAKWRGEITRIVSLLTPDDGRPFRLGIYGTDGVFVSGPGVIDWVNTDNPNDITIPTVLESGKSLRVTQVVGSGN